MKLTAREDVNASLDAVFAAVTDVPALERQALRRGLSVTRLDAQETVGVGSRWEVAFDYRGHRRVTLSEVTLWDPAQGVAFVTEADGLRGIGLVDLTRLAKERTRLEVSVDIRPETFRARLLLQSLKLAKSGLQGRFRKKVAEYVSRIGRASD